MRAERPVPARLRRARSLAQEQRRRWHGDLTLDTTALVHEAYLKVVGQNQAAVREVARISSPSPRKPCATSCAITRATAAG